MFNLFAITLLHLLFFCDNGNAGDGFSSEFSFKHIMEDPISISEWMLTLKPVKRDLITVMSVCNRLCTEIHFETPHSLAPKQENIHFVLMTPTANYSYSMEEAGQIIQNPAFNPNWNTTIYSSGWKPPFGEGNDALFGISNAFLCAGNINFIAINSAKYLDNLMYPWTALSSAAIGKFVAIGIEKLTRVYPIAQIRLVGHSLGAQLVGAAARHFTKLTGILLPRVTGLDPAKPCFENNPRLPSLHSGDAQFVDIIHTDPGIYAIPYPIGDVDFYPNGLNPIPTDCKSVLSAHYRAWMYYAESLYPGNANGFMAVNCTSEKKFDAGLCTGRQYPMGYYCPADIRGNMYLRVNNEPPYGMNSIPPSQIQCAPSDSSNSNIMF